MTESGPGNILLGPQQHKFPYTLAVNFCAEKVYSIASVLYCIVQEMVPDSWNIINGEEQLTIFIFKQKKQSNICIHCKAEMLT